MELKAHSGEDISLALAQALHDCRARGERMLVLPKGEYHVSAPLAEETVCCVSNHGHNGFKAAALLLDGFDTLTIDGSGSRFILHGKMDFAIIRKSRDITLKNFSLTCADSCNFQGAVTEAGAHSAVVRLESPPPELALHGSLLVQPTGEGQLMAVRRVLAFDPDSGDLCRGTGDTPFGAPLEALSLSLEGETLRLSGLSQVPPVGSKLVFATSLRCNQAFLIDRSSRITLEDIRVQTTWGMAFLAQASEDITLERCQVTPEAGRFWSAGQDASHFAACRGHIAIRDCRFENQLDDAVNLHGIYTRVEAVRGRELLVAFGHPQTAGIRFYRPGDELALLWPEDQRPLARACIAGVEHLNQHRVVLTLEEAVPAAQVGMLAEDLSAYPTAEITGCRFRRNRARGMLLASRGATLVQGNTFHCPGPAIQLESDPFRWLESGGVEDLTVRENLFDDCRYGAWGRAVIDICPRRKTVPGFYYHRAISILENRFTQGGEIPCVAADSVERLLFQGNCCSDRDRAVAARHTNLNGSGTQKEGT